MMLEDGESLTSDGPTSMIDPLIQYDEGHDHRKSTHLLYRQYPTCFIQPINGTWECRSTSRRFSGWQNLCISRRMV